MKRTQHWHGGALAAALVLSACVVDEGPAGPSSDELAEHLATLECAARFMGVCGEPQWSDEPTCARERAQEIADAYDEAIAAGLRYDASCAVSLYLPEPTPVWTCGSPCSIFSGDGQEGEPCTRTNGMGSTCGPTLDCVLDVCAPIVDFLPRPEGESCVDEQGNFAVLCQEGLICDVDGGGLCIAGPAVGEQCALVGGQPVRCGVGHFCDFETSTCQVTRAIGEPCGSTGPSACQSFSCVDGVCALNENAICSPLETPYDLGCG